MSEPALNMIESSTVDLTCFEIKGEIYAIEVEYVREIVRILEITPLPNSPRLIEGVIDLRGMVIPVMDLGRVLGRGPGSTSMRSRIIVLEIDGLALGVWVDAATDVLTLDAQRLEDVPQLATQAGYDAVCHLIRRDGESPIMVLSVDRLIESIDQSPPPDESEMEAAQPTGEGEAP